MNTPPYVFLASVAINASAQPPAGAEEAAPAALRSAAMRVEVLYFDGCPNNEALLPHLRQLLASAGALTDIELVHVHDAEAAERQRFLGSPTVRIDGQDIEPGAAERTDFGLKCRLFATPDGLRGIPADAWVLTALDRHRAD